MCIEVCTDMYMCIYTHTSMHRYLYVYIGVYFLKLLGLGHSSVGRVLV